MENNKKERVMKILKISGNVLIWIFVAFSALITIMTLASQGNKHGVPSLFGYGIVSIETPSMEPTYNVGDLVFVEMVDDETLKNVKKGDIITFRVPVNIDEVVKKGDLLTHRVISNENGVIKTQGDNKETNPVADKFTLIYTDIAGICKEDKKAAGLGNIIKFLREPMGFLLCIVVPMIIFFGFELYNFIHILMVEKAKKQPQVVSKETEEEIKQRAIEEYLANMAKEQAKNNVAPAEDSSEGNN